MQGSQEKNNTAEFNGSLVQPPAFYRQWMLAGNPSLFFDRLVQDHGDFVHYRGLLNFYLINHPALMKQVLKETNRTFDKRTPIYRRFKNVHGSGLVVSEGARWKRQRKMMQPVFNGVAVRQFLDIMVNASSTLADDWSERCESGVVFNIADDMNHLALEIAGRALFSTGFTPMRDEIEQWTRVINRYSAKPPLPIVRDIWFPPRVTSS